MIQGSTLFDSRLPHLANFVEDQMIDRIPAEESKFHFIARRSLQVVASLVGTAARYPFVSIVLAFAGENKPLGYSLALGSSVSFGAVISWCLLKIIDFHMRPLSEAEKGLLNQDLPKLQSTIMTIGVFAMGFFSQVPMAYMSYTYNNDNAFYGLGDIFVDSAYPIHSLHMSASDLVKMRRLSLQEKVLQPLKDKLINKLESKRKGLAYASHEFRQAFLEKLADIRRSEPPTSKMHQYLIQILINIPSYKQPVEGKCIKKGRMFAQGIGGVLAISQLVFGGVLGYHSSKIFFDSTALRVSFAALVVFCSIYLNFNILMSNLGSFYDLNVNLTQGIAPKNLESVLYPNAWKTIAIIALMFAGFSFIGPYEVCQDFFSGNFKTYMQVTCIIASIIVCLHAMLILTNEGISNGAKYFGSEENKQLLEQDELLSRLIYLIRESKMGDFLKFVNSLPADKLESWMSKLKISSSMIQAFHENESIPILNNPS